MEPLFKKLSQINALLILVILTAIFLTLFIFAKPAIEAYGLKFLIDPRWGVVVKEESSISAPSPDALPSNRQNVTSGNSPTSTSPGKGENATSQTSSTGQTPGNYTPRHSETTQISSGVPDDQINMEKEDIDLTPPPAVLEYFKTHPTHSTSSTASSAGVAFQKNSTGKESSRVNSTTSPGVPDDQINMEKEDIDLTPPPEVLEYFKTHPTHSTSSTASSAGVAFQKNSTGKESSRVNSTTSPGVPDDQINMEKEDIDLTPPPEVLEYFQTHKSTSTSPGVSPQSSGTSSTSSTSTGGSPNSTGVDSPSTSPKASSNLQASGSTPSSDGVNMEEEDELGDIGAPAGEKGEKSAGVQGEKKEEKVKVIYGGLIPIVGTILSTLIALIFAVPIALGISIFLTEIAPPFIEKPVGIAIELLAAIPSIIYGMWGLFYFGPLVSKIFGGSSVSLLVAGLVLGIMIIPFIASLTRDAMKTTPGVLKESAYAVGATKFEVIKDVVFPYAKRGIIGSIILALGRALGETMAVAFVIGGVFSLPKSLTDPTISIPVVLANNFAESSGMSLSALFYLALILFILSFAVITYGKFKFLNNRKGD